MLTSAHCTAGRCGHRPLRASKYRKAFRISYVKYSTGANITTNTAYPAMRKPDSAVARKGVRTTERGTTTRKTERIVFLRVSAISFSSVLFFHIFSRKREKIWSPKAQLQRRCKNSTSGASGKEFRACGAAGGQHPQGVCRIRSAPDGADGCAESSAPTQGRKRPEFHTSNIQRALT